MMQSRQCFFKCPTQDSESRLLKYGLIHSTIGGLLGWGAYECFMRASADTQLKTFGILTSMPAGYAAILALVSIWVYSKDNDVERKKKADGLLFMGTAVACLMLTCGAVGGMYELIVNYGAEHFSLSPLYFTICVILSLLGTIGSLAGTFGGIHLYQEGIEEEHLPVYGPLPSDS